MCFCLRLKFFAKRTLYIDSYLCPGQPTDEFESWVCGQACYYLRQAIDTTFADIVDMK